MTEINLSTLSPEDKQRSWAKIKAEQPSLAEFMLSEEYARMRDELGCSVILEGE